MNQGTRIITHRLGGDGEYTSSTQPRRFVLHTTNFVAHPLLLSQEVMRLYPYKIAFARPEVIAVERAQGSKNRVMLKVRMEGAKAENNDNWFLLASEAM